MTRITLIDAVKAHGGRQAQALEKHLRAADLLDWNDLTKARLNDLRDSLESAVAKSSARTYMAVLKVIIGRYEEDYDIPCKNFRDVLKVKNEKPHKTFLTKEELLRLEKVEVKSESEQYVLDEFLIGAYTGMRVSDSKEVSKENVNDGFLSYVSIKTGIRATIPVGERTIERIERVQGKPEMYMNTYNDILRRLCKRADITEPTKVVKGGKHLCEPKFNFVSSHTARISFCTNLARLKVPILDISRMAGHSDIATTMRYIIPTQIDLSKEALSFLV